MRFLLKKVPRPRLTLTLAGLFALYLVLGFFVLPRYLQRAIPEQVAQHLKREALVGEVRVNPLLLSVELRDFALKDTDGRAMVGLRRLLVDFEVSSLLRWAWTFSAIELDGLEVNADIAPDGRFNFAALIADLPKSEAPAAPAGKPPRLLLQHLALIDSAVTFSDRTGPKPAIATLRPLAIELRDLTTLPDRRGPYTISARLPGNATLAWRGEMSLAPIFSIGEVSLRDGRPAAVWRFFENRLRIAEPAGSVEVGLRYRAAYTDGTPELVVEDIRFAASDIALSERGAKEPFFALKAASASGGRFDLARRELHVPSIELRGAAVRVQTDADGTLNLLKLLPETEPAVTKAPAGQPWRVKLDAVGLREVALQYRDFSRALPMGVRVGALDVGLGAALEVGAGDPQVTADGIAVKLSGIALGEALSDDFLARIDSVDLAGGSFDLRRQAVAARRLAIKGGDIRVARETDGRVRLLEVARPGAGAPPRPAPKATRPWRFALDAFDLEGLKVAVADQSFERPLTYDIDPVTIAVRNVRSEGKAPIRLDAALKVAQGGSLRLSGEATPAGDRASGRVTLERLNLAPLQPAVASRTTLALASGEVSATFQAQYRSLKGRPANLHELRGTGSASVDNLLINEAASGERFLEWKSVAASGIALDLAPDRLAIAEVAVRGLGAKVFVNKDRSVNLAQAVKPAREPAAPAPAPPAAADAQPAFPVSIERVRVDKAAVDFTDLSLVLPFAAKIQELDGDLLGLSTDRASRAIAKLEGRVDEFGLARIDGSLATYDPRAFLDLRVEFRNVEMTPLSAYSATFAGRRIASGRLGIDLRYKIDKGVLAGDNAVEMQNFTLGEAIDAPGALSLPLDLAVALLTDKDGRIALAVPVKGDVNSPEFSYGHLVWQALSTVITNIVSAPFRALFGGGGENLESVTFDPGRAALLPPEREKLKRVAEALGQRPQLALAVEGQHSDADRAALRRRDVAAAIDARLERARPGEEPLPVNARDAATQRALEALFVQRNSEEALAAFIAEGGKPRAKDGAFYDALLARLNETAPLAEDARDKLAVARANAVVEHLEKSLAVPAARLATKVPTAADGERARLVLGPAPAKP